MRPKIAFVFVTSEELADTQYFHDRVDPTAPVRLQEGSSLPPVPDLPCLDQWKAYSKLERLLPGGSRIANLAWRIMSSSFMTAWRHGSESGVAAAEANNPLSNMFHPAATSPHELQTPAHVLAAYSQSFGATLPMDWDPTHLQDSGASASALPAKPQTLPLGDSNSASVSQSALEQQLLATICDWAHGAPGSAGLVSPLGVQPSLMFSNPSNQAGVTDFNLSNQGFAPAFVTPLTDLSQAFPQNDGSNPPSALNMFELHNFHNGNTMVGPLFNGNDVPGLDSFSSDRTPTSQELMLSDPYLSSLSLESIGNNLGVSESLLPTPTSHSVSAYPASGLQPPPSHSRTVSAPFGLANQGLEHSRSVSDSYSPPMSASAQAAPKLSHSPSTSAAGTSPSKGKDGGHSCANCGTDSTSQWRRDKEKRRVCNSCGLYAKLHHVSRPISISSKQNAPLKRNRKKKSIEAINTLLAQQHGNNAASKRLKSGSVDYGNHPQRSPLSPLTLLPNPPMSALTRSEFDRLPTVASEAGQPPDSPSFLSALAAYRVGHCLDKAHLSASAGRTTLHSAPMSDANGLGGLRVSVEPAKGAAMAMLSPALSSTPGTD
ncbi:hypothetical protein H4R34_002291 [Dimargaris verticillata]|uniref:GATA-type domain-containing protein n=1 Tax=Dimargaris verticillata TaxID=2761393 RepID=A0A9W8B4F7_9FUNG|nr:hypothetical protein H4R34_002291 [Dimargaris verticillata]